MPLPLQVKLLRVLQERKARRLGGTRDIPLQARIMSATNRNIEELVRVGRFREDLYYRLNVVRIAVPPLRERRDDIPLLAGHLLEKVRLRMGKPAKSLTHEARTRSRAPLPREHQGTGEHPRAGDNRLRGGDDPRRRPGPGTGAAADRNCRGRGGGPWRPPRVTTPGASVEAASPGSIEKVEREAIARALARWKGNRTRAAQELGMNFPAHDHQQDKTLRAAVSCRCVGILFPVSVPRLRPGAGLLPVQRHGEVLPGGFPMRDVYSSPR